MCKDHSYVCEGIPDKHWAMDFLPDEEGKCLYMTENDERLVRNIINIRFGRKSLEKTRFGTTTQKCEATNRGYRKSDPQNVTYHRNYATRVHSSAHRINHGPGESALLKCEGLGVPLPPNSRPVDQLQKEDNIYTFHRLRKREPRVKKARIQSVISNFKEYDTVAEEKETYRKGLADSDLCEVLTRKTRSKTRAEHGYSK